MTRLTFGEDTDSMDPIWTPDGERIIYASSRESVFFGKGDIYCKPADGTGEADKLASASDRAISNPA